MDQPFLAAPGSIDQFNLFIRRLKPFDSPVGYDLNVAHVDGNWIPMVNCINLMIINNILFGLNSKKI